jgi:hypothetical protein
MRIANELRQRGLIISAVGTSGYTVVVQRLAMKIFRSQNASRMGTRRAVRKAKATMANAPARLAHRRGTEADRGSGMFANGPSTAYCGFGATAFDLIRESLGSDTRPYRASFLKLTSNASSR